MDEDRGKEIALKKSGDSYFTFSHSVLALSILVSGSVFADTRERPVLAPISGEATSLPIEITIFSLSNFVWFLCNSKRQ